MASMGPGGIDYSSSPRGYRLDTSIAPMGTTLGGGFGGFGMPQNLVDLMNWRLRKEAEDREFARRLREEQFGEMQRRSREDQMFQQKPMQLADDDEGLRAAQRHAGATLAQAAARPTPTKLIQGFNIVPGYVSDTMQLPYGLLPKAAGFERGGLGVEEQRGLATAEPESVTAEREARAEATRAQAQETNRRTALEEAAMDERRRALGDPYYARKLRLLNYGR